ncbi:MAG: hypothetical protein NTX25_20210 [Proteobacteria bacterium]|nr:hypothetical protein [Pseudomonadota bacterium]
MYSHLISCLMISALATSVSTAKDYLRKDPMLAGALIKYCENTSPKSCATVDRRKEVSPTVDKATAIGEISSRLGDIAADFSSLSIRSDGIEFLFDFKQENPNKAEH